MHDQSIWIGPEKEPLPECDKQAGRFRKKDAYDCGKPGCVVCHFTKVMGIKRHKQVLADLSFREQLD